MPACARPSTRASRPSTPPTSTPAPRPRRCSAGRWRASAARGLEIFTKVYWPTGPGPNDRGLSRKHITRVDQRLAAPAADRLRRPLPGAPLRRRDAARGDDGRLRRPRPRRARCSTSASREWTADQIAAGAALAPRAAASRSCPTSRSTPCSGGSSRPRSSPPARASGLGQIVWSPIAQGVLTGKYLPGQPPPEGSRATDEPAAPTSSRRFMRDDVLTRVQQLKPIAARRSGLSHGPARRRLGPAEPERRRGDRRRLPARAGARQRQGRGRQARRRGAAPHRRGARPIVERDPAKTASPPKRA